MSDLSDEIEAAVSAPKQVTTDGVTVEGRDVDELIKADQYLQNKQAASSKSRGLRFSKISPPGAS